MPEPVLIVGAGKLGALLYDCLFGDDRWQCVGFVDDGKAGETFQELPVIGLDDCLPGKAFIAIGFPDLRRRMIARGSAMGLDWQTYVDRRALVGHAAQVGRGCIILSFAMVSSSVTLGDFVYCSSYSHVGTGSSIGAYTSVMAGASVGEAQVGEDCVLGLKSVCLDGILLGDRVTVAPTTFVRRSVPSDMMIAGHPARAFRKSALMPSNASRDTNV